MSESLVKKNYFSGVAEISGHNMTMETSLVVLFETFHAALSRMNIVKINGKNFSNMIKSTDYFRTFEFLVPKGKYVKYLYSLDYKAVSSDVNNMIQIVVPEFKSISVGGDGNPNSAGRNEEYSKYSENWDVWKFQMLKNEGQVDKSFFVFAVVWGDTETDNLSFISYFDEAKRKNDGNDINFKDVHYVIRNHIANLAAGNPFGQNSYNRYSIDMEDENFFKPIETVKPVNIDIPVVDKYFPFPNYRYDEESGKDFMELNDFSFPAGIFDTSFLESDLIKVCFFLRKLIEERVTVEEFDIEDDDLDVDKDPEASKLNDADMSLGHIETLLRKTLAQVYPQKNFTSMSIQQIIANLMENKEFSNLYDMIDNDSFHYCYFVYLAYGTQRNFKLFMTEKGLDKLYINRKEYSNLQSRNDCPIVLPVFCEVDGYTVVNYPEQNKFSKELLIHVKSIAKELEDFFMPGKKKEYEQKTSTQITYNGRVLGIISRFDNGIYSVPSLFLKNSQIMKMVSGCSAKHLESLGTYKNQKLSHAFGYGCINRLALEQVHRVFKVSNNYEGEYLWSNTNRNSVFNEMIGMTTSQIESLFFEGANAYNSYGSVDRLLLDNILKYHSTLKYAKSMTHQRMDSIRKLYHKIMNEPIVKYALASLTSIENISSGDFLPESKRGMEGNVGTSDEEKKETESFIRVLQVGPTLHCASRISRETKTKNPTPEAPRSDTTKITYAAENPEQLFRILKVIEGRTVDVGMRYCDGGAIYKLNVRDMHEKIPETATAHLAGDYLSPYGQTAKRIYEINQLIGHQMDYFNPYNFVKSRDKADMSMFPAYIYEVKFPNSSVTPQVFTEIKDRIIPHVEEFKYTNNANIIDLKRIWTNYIFTGQFLGKCLESSDAGKTELIFSLLLARQLERSSRGTSIYDIMPFNETKTNITNLKIAFLEDKITRIRQNFLVNCDVMYELDRKRRLLNVYEEFKSMNINLSKSVTEIFQEISFTPTMIVNAFLLRYNFENMGDTTLCMSKLAYLCLSASAYYQQHNITVSKKLSEYINSGIMQRNLAQMSIHVKEFENSNQEVFANISNAPMYGLMESATKDKETRYLKTMYPAFSVYCSALYYFTRAIPASNGKTISFTSLEGKPFRGAASKGQRNIIENYEKQYVVTPGRTAIDYQKVNAGISYGSILSNGQKREASVNTIWLIEKKYNEMLSKMEDDTKKNYNANTERIIQEKRLSESEAAKFREARNIGFHQESGRERLNIMQRSGVVLDACRYDRSFLNTMVPENERLVTGKNLNASILLTVSHKREGFSTSERSVDPETYTLEKVRNFLSQFSDV